MDMRSLVSPLEEKQTSRYESDHGSVSYMWSCASPWNEEEGNGKVLSSLHPLDNQDDKAVFQRNQENDGEEQDAKVELTNVISRQSTESFHMSHFFTGQSGEWWIQQESSDGACGSTCEVKLQEGWWGRCPLEKRGKRTTILEKGFFGWLRHRVADNRNRYEFDGFDLDLAYVTSRIIAMGFPSTGARTSFRNPKSEVDRFLRQAHGDDFRIYNLCAERSHANNGFERETVCFPCADHCPPDMAMLLQFCQDVESWLERKPTNVAAIHCKAGKGRSGTVVCAFLIYAQACSSAREALWWFAHIRGGTRSGVTIPSQIRWVAMFDKWLRDKVELSSSPLEPLKQKYQLRAVRLGPFSKNQLMRNGDGEKGNLKVQLEVGLANRDGPDGFQWVHWYAKASITLDKDYVAYFALPESGPVWATHDGMLCLRISSSSGTSCAVFSQRSGPPLKISAWWHHSFLRRSESEGASTGQNKLLLDLPKVFVDGLQKDVSKHKLVPPKFHLRAEFHELDR